MYYSEEVIDNVREANNIVDVIGTYVPLKKKGSTYFGPCPFHSEKTPSFSVTNTNDKHMYYCFGCHVGGDVISFIMKYENISYVEAIQMLAERAGIALPVPDYSKEKAERERKRQQVFEINRLAGTYFFRLLKSDRGSTGLNYLKGRGLSNSTIMNFGLGYADKYKDDLYKYIKSLGYTDDILKESGLFSIKEEGGRDYFWNRVMFPIMDVRNKIVGFGGRVMGDGEPKYLNSPETICFDKGRTLYGLNFAKKVPGRELILVEGYMDVISLHQSGFANAVAGLGTALTDGNVTTLRRYADSVILSYDSDGAGQDATLRAIEKLRRAHLAVKVVNLRPYKDPDELIKAEGQGSYQERLKGAMNALIYEVYSLKENYDISNPDDKTRFYNEIAKKIAFFDDEIERSSYITAVSREFFIDAQALEGAVKRYALTRSAEGYFTAPAKTVKKSEAAKSALEECCRIILSYVWSDADIYRKVSGILAPKDFPLALYKEMAEIIFSQRAAGRMNSMEILDAFPEMDEREKAAQIFYYKLENMDEEAVRQTLTDCVIKIKRNSLEKKLAAAADFGEMVAVKKEMENTGSIKLFE